MYTHSTFTTTIHDQPLYQCYTRSLNVDMESPHQSIPKPPPLSPSPKPLPPLQQKNHITTILYLDAEWKEEQVMSVVRYYYNVYIQYLLRKLLMITSVNFRIKSHKGTAHTKHVHGEGERQFKPHSWIILSPTPLSIDFAIHVNCSISFYLPFLRFMTKRSKTKIRAGL